MSTLNRKIEAYLNRKPDFNFEVLLEDNYSNGVSNPYIKEWNVDGVAKPTDEQLDALSSQAETLENNAIAVANRQKEYGNVETQLEFLVENGVDAFITRQNEIKTKYPKENS